VRCTLLWLAEKDHVVLLTLHHIISDGWSMEILIREVSTLYQAFSRGQPSPLPELPIQYSDYAAWQRDWLQGETLEKQLAHWMQQLDGDIPVLNLPTDRPRPPVQTHRGARELFTVPQSLAEALRALSQQEEASLFMTLLAAFNVLLYRYTGQEDILVGSPVTNRHRAEVREVIGFFVNTLVLRTDLSGEPSFRELLRRVRDTALAAYAHQDLPFEKLVAERQPERDMSRSSLFDVSFALHSRVFSEPSQVSGLTATLLAMENEVALFDLTLSVGVTDEGLGGVLEYNTDLFDASTAARMAGHFQVLLESIVADPDRRICDLPLLTEAEQRQLLAEWNDTRTEYPTGRCIHHLPRLSL
jgi:hypothetical protein